MCFFLLQRKSSIYLVKFVSIAKNQCVGFFLIYLCTTIFTFFAHCVLKESFLSKDLDYQKDYTILLYSLHVCFLLSFHKTFRNKKNLINWYNTKVLDIEYTYICWFLFFEKIKEFLEGYVGVY